ncbi:hypothetical protein ABZP36_004303 [Zizania latifolia]
MAVFAAFRVQLRDAATAPLMEVSAAPPGWARTREVEVMVAEPLVHKVLSSMAMSSSTSSSSKKVKPVTRGRWWRPPHRPLPTPLPVLKPTARRPPEEDEQCRGNQKKFYST